MLTPSQPPPHVPPSPRVPTRGDAVRIALVYGAIGALWILTSDWMLHQLVPNPDIENFLAMVKGWCYVLVTAIALGVALDRYFRSIRQSTQHVHESEDSLRNLFNAIPESVFLMETNGTILAANETFATRLGTRPEKCVGASVYSFVSPEVGARRRIWIEQALTRRQPVVFDDSRDGLFLRHSVCPVVGQDGRVERVVVSAVDLTEMKQFEAALRDSELRMSLAIDAANMGLWDLNLATGKTIWSRTQEAMFGYAPGEFPGTQEGFMARVHPEDHEGLTQIGTRALQERTPFQSEFRVIWPDGSERWVCSRGRHLFDAAGQPERLVGVAFDITERKHAELARRRSELQQRAILDNIPDPIWMKDIQGRFLAVNKAWCAFTGKSSDEALGKRDIEIFPAVVAEWLRAQDLGVIAAVEPQRWEETMLDRDGNARTFETIKARFADPSGKVSGTVGIARDISDRKRSDRQLRQLSRAVEQSPVSIVITDKEGVIEYVNPKFTAVTGYSLEEAQGHTPRLLKSNVMPAEHYRRLWGTLLEGQEWRGELHNRKKNGDLFWELACISPITDRSGTITHFVAVKEDITEAKRLEAFRHALLDLGKQLNNARDPVSACRALFATADQLWAWDAAILRVFDARTNRVHSILRVDIVDGRRCELPKREVEEMTPRARRVIANGAELTLRDEPCAADPDWVPFGDVARRSASIMTVPLRREEQVIGILSIQSYTPHAYTPEDLRTLQALADYCGGALERLRSEEALVQSVERYRSLVETSFDWVWEVDAERRYTFTSPKVEDLLGYTSGEVLGKTPFDLMPTPEAYRVQKIFEEIMARREPFSGLENFNKHKDGRLVVLESSGTPFFGPHGEFAGYRGVDRNITERKQAEAALTASEEKFRTLVENAPIGIFLQGGGRFIYLNREARRMFGDGAQERLMGCPVLDRFHKSTHRKVLERIRRLNEERQAVEVAEERCIRLDGTEFDGEFQAVPFNCEGKAGALVFFQDVTQRKSLEAQLRQSQKLEGIGQLAGGVAHDFNNILAAIMMHLGLLQMNKDLDRDIAQSLTELDGEARRAATLTRQLLMFSRRSVLSVTAVDMNEVVANLLKMLGRLIGEQVRIRFDGQSGLPSVEADAGMMEQVLMNLVVNARDAMPDGGRITIVTSVVTFDEMSVGGYQERRPGRFVGVGVSDTGCGMEPAILKRVFEPFFTTKETGKGTGLGLATVHGIVAQHHGWVEVDSEVGKGTHFRVYLPAMDSAAMGPSEEKTTQPVGGGKETILLVEDDPTVRMLVGQSLRKLGYTIHEAANGKEAMVLWQDFGSSIDLLFTDMVMPEGMTGLELVERLQAMKPGLKAIISSGYSSEMVHAGKPTRAGVHYLPKPYETHVLAAAVRTSLERGD